MNAVLFKFETDNNIFFVKLLFKLEFWSMNAENWLKLNCNIWVVKLE